MKRIREIRESKGVSKAAMCRYLGISKPTYDEYENNPQNMRLSTAQKVADFLNVPLADIFFLSNSK